MRYLSASKFLVLSLCKCIKLCKNCRCDTATFVRSVGLPVCVCVSDCMLVSMRVCAFVMKCKTKKIAQGNLVVTYAVFY